MLKGRQRWPLVSEVVRELGILMSVFGLLDFVYQKSEGNTLPVGWWWVVGYVAVGVAFLSSWDFIWGSPPTNQALCLRNDLRKP